jgi:hypothetical protein
MEGINLFSCDFFVQKFFLTKFRISACANVLLTLIAKAERKPVALLALTSWTAFR